MRIALIYDAMYPYIRGGGERIFYEIARRLGERHEVHMFAMKLWPGKKVEQLYPGVWAHGVCPSVSLYKEGEERRRRISQALQFAAYLPFQILKNGRFDIIDCMSTPYFCLYTTKLACLLKRTPLVSTWLEIWPQEEWERYMGKAKGKVAGGIERTAARIPSHIIAISEHTRKGLEDIGTKPERISVISPGIDFKNIRNVTGGPRSNDILSVGRLIREKRVDVLLEALSTLRESMPDIRCRIVGDGPEREHLEKKAKNLGIEKNVTFLGFIESSDDVYREMKTSKVMALLSQREGFGIAVTEAACSGLPVVTVDDPKNAAAYLVDSGHLGATCQIDAQEVARSILDLLRDEERRESIGQNAVEWSRGFDWNAVVKRYERLYQSQLQ